MTATGSAARGPAAGTSAATGLAATIERLQRLADHTVPMTIRAVCELGVADRLAGGPRDVDDLAADVGAHPGALYRALRALASVGIFAETGQREFALTPMGQLLRGDHPLSLRDAYPLIPADFHAWARVDHTLRTGEPSFEEVSGLGYYDHLARNPGDSARFDKAVEAQNRLVLRALLSAYDWADRGLVVDVASGNGAFLAGLLARYKALRGVAFDLPHVVAGAGEVLAAAGVADRCEVVAGSFFERVPAGGDTYLLKTILHDWDDQRAATILRAIRAAMRPRSRLLVLEAIVPPGDEFHISKLLDLHSLVLAGGPDRTVEEFAALLAGADLRLDRVTPTDTLTFLEAVPAES